VRVDYERDQHPPPTPTQKASLKIFHATTQKTKKKWKPHCQTRRKIYVRDAEGASRDRPRATQGPFDDYSLSLFSGRTFSIQFLRSTKFSWKSKEGDTRGQGQFF
jgi:hypothetical protein